MGLFSGSRPENLGTRDGRLAPCKSTPNSGSSPVEADKDGVRFTATDLDLAISTRARANVADPRQRVGRVDHP